MSKNTADNRERIIQAAIACFRRYSAPKTTMEDIAREAGLGRKTVYRTFGNRLELLEAVAVRRLDAMTDKVQQSLEGCSNLAEAIVTGSLEIIRLARADRVFETVVDAASDGDLMRYFVDPDSPILQHAQSLWSEILARARASGELRPGPSDEDIENWMRGVHLIMYLRDDQSAEDQRAMLERFVLPALLRPERASRRRR